MLRAFFSDTCDRPSCYECSFKKRYRVSDFTIWDCFSVYDFDKKLDDDKGTTRVLCHSQKAASLMQEVMEYARCEEVSADKLVAGVKEMFESVPISTAAEAVVTPIQLHAWGFIVMERTASHPVPTYMDSIMLRSLSCRDGLLHSFNCETIRLAFFQPLKHIWMFLNSIMATITLKN